MKKWLFWGAALRIIFESYLELTISITIGIIHMYWPADDFAVIYNNIFTIAMAVIVIIMPLYSSIFYGLNVDEMDETEFKSKFGTLYEGLNLDMDENKRKYALLFPFFYIVRRLLFVASAIWLEHFLWAQLAIQFACSVTMMIYLQSYRPFNDKIFTTLETFNEVTTIFLLYHMFTFTDWLPLASTRYIMGWSFIIFTSANLLVHVLLLLIETVKNTRYSWRKQAHKLRVKKALKKNYERKAENERTPIMPPNVVKETKREEILEEIKEEVESIAEEDLDAFID